MHEACFQKKGDLVQLLIDDDWSLGKSLLKDQGELDGHPLYEGSLRLLRTKMGKDAVTDDVAWAQFQKACNEGQHQSVKHLLPYGLPANHDLLLTAVDKRDYDTIDFLLNNGFDVNARFGDGQTCLLEVASRSIYQPDSSSSYYGLDWPDAVLSSRLIDILLDHGADIETTNHRGNNFFHLAAQCDSSWSMSELFHLTSPTKLFSALSTVNQEGQTPALVAEQFGNEQFLAFVDSVNQMKGLGLGSGEDLGSDQDPPRMKLRFQASQLEHRRISGLSKPEEQKLEMIEE